MKLFKIIDVEFLKQGLLWNAIFIGIGLVIVGIIILIMLIKSKKY